MRERGRGRGRGRERGREGEGEGERGRKEGRRAETRRDRESLRYSDIVSIHLLLNEGCARAHANTHTHARTHTHTQGHWTIRIDGGGLTDPARQDRSCAQVADSLQVRIRVFPSLSESIRVFPSCARERERRERRAGGPCAARVRVHPSPSESIRVFLSPTDYFRVHSSPSESIRVFPSPSTTPSRRSCGAIACDY